MDIVRLPDGETAPPDSDCIRLTTRPDGSVELTGSLLQNCGNDADAVSVALISSDLYPGEAEAEQAGLAWANDHCVALLYVSREKA